MPALLVAGLLLIPFGMWLERRRLLRHPGAEREWFVIDFRSPTTRRRAVLFTALTAVNVVIVLVAGYGSLHSMESPSFCGQTCHTPMHPQFTAWQDAPHSQVTCVQCHIGEGGRAFVKYKMNGLRQLYHVVTGGYPRPIPGVADLRPAIEVCGNCHWPGKGFGDVVRVKREYADDETNTETATILQLFVGGPGAPTPAGRAIHWHADPRVQIEFIYTDAERQTIQFVKYTDAQGRVREYAAEGTTPEQLAKGSRRTMDCVDCHNVRGASRRAGAGAGGGCGDRGGPDRPRPAVRPSRRRAPDEGELPDRRRRRADDRRGIAKVLHAHAAAAPMPRSRVRSPRCRTSTGATCFPR